MSRQIRIFPVAPVHSALSSAVQNTANLWALLCEELETRRTKESAEQQSAAARTFEDAAKQVFRDNSPRMRDALEIAGDIHQAAGAHPDALRCFNEALQFALRAGGYAPAARIATKMAFAAEAMGNIADAIGNYTSALEFHENARQHGELPTLLNNLARLERQQGNFQASEQHYLRAIREAEQTHGRNNPEVALIANNLGVAYTERGELSRAEDMHMMALAIRETSFGSHHPDVAQSMANLAVVYHVRKQYLKAEKFYRGAMEILASFRAADDPEVAKVRTNFERLPQIQKAKTQKI
jgi:tetratricopeptide (TPR) repeat protein